MAQLSHNQYYHPLLWCESKRHDEDKRIAEESRPLVQQCRELREAQKTCDCEQVRVKITR